jgi:molecular chaperone HscB
MTNPFQALSLPASFDVDLSLAHQRYIAASAANHPDRFTDPLDQADAAERSALINDAYRTIKDPASRAEALLALLGGPAKESDKSLPPDLLMEMMEAREGLDEAKDTGDQSQINKWRDWATQRHAVHLSRIAELFGQLQPPGQPQDATQPASQATLKAVRVELNALRYFERMIQEG